MAKRKRARGATASVPYGGNRRQTVSSRIDEAENGFIVHACREGGPNGYEEKKYVATSKPKAMRIAATHLAGAEKKTSGKKKASRGKRYASKNA